jgi:hypothetical protein
MTNDSFPEWVHVPGREEVARVLQHGKNQGSPSMNVYCWVLHFPSTGEVAFYDAARLRRADAPAN